MPQPLNWILWLFFAVLVFIVALWMLRQLGIAI